MTAFKNHMTEMLALKDIGDDAVVEISLMAIA